MDKQTLGRMAEVGLTRREVAHILGMNYMTLYKKIRSHGLVEEFNRNGNAKKSRDKRRRCRECREWVKR